MVLGTDFFVFRILTKLFIIIVISVLVQNFILSWISTFNYNVFGVFDAQWERLPKTGQSFNVILHLLSKHPTDKKESFLNRENC